MTAATTEPAAPQAAAERLSLALRYAHWGIGVFPLAPGSKVPPAGSQGHHGASTDPDQIHQWFADNPDMNWGAVGGAERFDPIEEETEHLVWLDVDQKPGKDGLRSLNQACQAAGIRLDDFATLAIKTPSGGLHLGFWTTQAIRHGVDVLGPGSGLDLRTEKGYVVGPGSIVNGKAYQIVNDAPIASMGKLADLFPTGPAEAKPVDRAPLPGIDPERAENRARDYLKTAPISIKGQGGDQTALKVAMRLKDEGCTEAQALDLMLSDHWHNGCGWAPERLAIKVANAFKYGQNPPGSSAPEAAFASFTAPQDPDATPHPLDKMNRDHAFVIVGGTGQILWDTTDEHGQPITKLLGLATFHQLHAAELFQAGKKRTEQLTEAWMTWPKRRTFEKLCLAPGEDLPPRFYNLWRGFAAAPAPGDWSRMRAHIRDVICSGNAALDRYVMGWLALMIQKPGKRAEVALVLRGGKGVGKGILGNALCRIFGRHALHLVNAKHLVGNFNGHMRETVFIFADESFWAGDRQHESTLKGIITEPEFMLEAKGKDAEMWPNRLHLLMASNDEWVAPASVDERRFCVLDVSPAHQQDTRYFGALMDQMEAGGDEAMLHDLLAWDLKGFNVYDIPKTKALTDQKISSLRGPDRWLHEALEEGTIFGHAWGDESLAVPKAEAYSQYCERSRRLYVEHHPAIDKVFWKKVRSAMQAGGLEIGDERPKTKMGRVRLAVFPPLEPARAAFAKYLRGEVEWGEPIGAGAAPEVDIFS